MFENGQNYITDDNRHDKFLPDDIPASITRRVWLIYGTGESNNGKIYLDDFVSRDGYYAGIPLEERALTFKIGHNRDSLSTALLGNLEKEKEEILAQNHMRLKEVQDKIDQLLAIEYKGTAP